LCHPQLGQDKLAKIKMKFQTRPPTSKRLFKYPPQSVKGEAQVWISHLKG
jgi:hypothetical protein